MRGKNAWTTPTKLGPTTIASSTPAAVYATTKDSRTVGSHTTNPFTLSLNAANRSAYSEKDTLVNVSERDDAKYSRTSGV